MTGYRVNWEGRAVGERRAWPPLWILAEEFDDMPFIKQSNRKTLLGSLSISLGSSMSCTVQPTWCNISLQLGLPRLSLRLSSIFAWVLRSFPYRFVIHMDLLGSIGSGDGSKSTNCPAQLLGHELNSRKLKFTPKIPALGMPCHAPRKGAMVTTIPPDAEESI